MVWRDIYTKLLRIRRRFKLEFPSHGLLMTSQGQKVEIMDSDVLYVCFSDILLYNELIRFYKRHIYTYGGGVVKTPIGIELKPSILIRYTEGAPIVADINLHALLMEEGPGGTQIWLGIGYRTRSVTVASIEMVLPYNLRLGYAYDFMASGLQDALGSTHEILLGFNFGGQTPLIQNPRYF